MVQYPYMTTQDVLFSVLALCAAVLTAFLAWFLYYLIAIVRDLRETSKLLHEKVSEVSAILDSIREKIGDTVSTLSILTQVVTGLADRWRQRRAKRNAKESDGG